MSDKHYDMGYRHGFKDGADPTEEYEQDFAYKPMSYVDGYWHGFKLARNIRLNAAKQVVPA